jgi:hypothetical protein
MKIGQGIPHCYKIGYICWALQLKTNVRLILRRNKFTNKSIFIFNVHGSVHRENILIYILQDATFHSLFHLETALHVSGGTTIHHQERKQLYLQHVVFVTPLLLPAAIAVTV